MWIYKLEREKATGRLVKLRNEEIRNFCSLPDVIIVMK
jgi:hypothetical protein